MASLRNYCALVCVILCITEGRICFSVLKDANQQSMEMKFQLLNPASPFREVVDTARSVILAGGTMSPVSHTCLFLQEIPDNRLVAGI